MRMIYTDICKEAEDPGRSALSNFWWRGSSETQADPYVQVTVGAQVQKTSVVPRSRLGVMTSRELASYIDV